MILKKRHRAEWFDKGAKSSEALRTPAEKRVLSLVSASMTNREIACILKISAATVKRHLENLLRNCRAEYAESGVSVRSQNPTNGCNVKEKGAC